MASRLMSSQELITGLQYPWAVLPRSRRANECFLQSRDRRVGVKGRTYAVQSEVVGPSMQDHAVTSYGFHYVVKEGDTLTSIARRYKTSLQLIALTNLIDDIDYLPVGKMLLVPVQSRDLNGENAKLLNVVKSLSPKDIEDPVAPRFTSQQSVSSAGLMPMILVSHSLGLVKAATSILILLVIISFGGKFLLDYIQIRIHKEISRRQAEREALYALRRPKMKRWQGILDCDRETDEDGAILSPDEEGQEAQILQKRLEDEEMQRSYAELESAYAKFLADSGLSKSGYWRGGLPHVSDE